MYILGIESSCDETAASIVKDGREIVSNIVYSQVEEHGLYGGVVPEIASRRHIDAISEVVQKAFDEDKVLENCSEMGAYMMLKLKTIGEKYSFVKGVRGRGLMIGLALDCEAGPVQKLIQKRNLLVLTAGESVVRFVPPLNIKKEDIDRALAIVDEALAEFAQEKDK